mgnify:CR=1 FL=1
MAITKTNILTQVRKRLGALHPKVGEPFDKNRWRYSGMTLGGHW